MRRNISRNNRPGGNEGEFSHSDSGDQKRPGTQRGSMFDQGFVNLPILIRLPGAIRIDGSGNAIIRDDRPRSDEHPILEMGTLEQHDARLYFAVSSN
jgi:hypothetical protein